MVFGHTDSLMGIQCSCHSQCQCCIIGIRFSKSWKIQIGNWSIFLFLYCHHSVVNEVITLYNKINTLIYRQHLVVFPNYQENYAAPSVNLLIKWNSLGTNSQSNHQPKHHKVFHEIFQAFCSVYSLCVQPEFIFFGE